MNNQISKQIKCSRYELIKSCIQTWMEKPNLSRTLRGNDRRPPSIQLPLLSYRAPVTTNTKSIYKNQLCIKPLRFKETKLDKEGK